MAGTTGPQLEGSITIPTQEFTKAVTALVKGADKMSKAMKDLQKAVGQTDKELDDSIKKYQKTGKTAEDAGKKQQDAARKVAALEEKKANAIARAANRVYNMEQAVKKSNASQEQQSAVISRIRKSLQQYADAVNNGSMKAREMDNANTKLGTSMGAAGRQLKEYTKTKETSARQDVANIKSQNTLRISYDRTANAVQQSKMKDAEKEQVMQRLKRQYEESSRALHKYGSRHKEGAQQIANFRTEASKANTTVRNVNAAARKKDLSSMTNQMRDLSSSVQLALGPLSGVASRIMALTALFSRNAAVVAGFIGGLTGLGVAFTKSFRAGVQAETQLLRLEGIVAGLGDQAVMTGQELFDMGTKTGMAFLTSAKQARDAAGVLASFGAVGRDQFEEVLQTAQGLATVTGRDLKSSVRNLGRLLEDPAKNFESLSRYTRAFSEETKALIVQLRAEGKVAEANSVILEHFAFASEAAEKESQRLAGSLDTTGELFGVMYENLFTTSGATTEATEKLTEFNQKLKEFGESEQIENLGEIFKTVVVAMGESILFLADNAKLLGSIFLGLATATGIKLIGWLLKVSGLIGIVTSKTKKAAVTAAVYDTAMKKSTVAVRGFSLALRSIPWVGVISAVAALIPMFMSFGSEGKEAMEKSSKAMEDVNEQIRMMPGLTDEGRERFSKMAGDIRWEMTKVEGKLDTVNDKMKGLGKAQTPGLAPSPSGLQMVPLTEEQTRANAQLTASIIQQTNEQFNLQMEMAKLNVEKEKAIDLAKEEANRNQQMGFAISDAGDKVKELRKEFDKESVKMEELAGKHKAAIALRDNLMQNYFALTDAEKEYVTMLVGTIIPAIEKEQKALKSSEEQTKANSRAYANLVSAMSEASSDIKILNKELSGASDMDIAKFTAGQKMEQELDKMSNAIKKLKDHELPDFAKELDVVFGENDSREEKVNALTEAFRKQHGSLLETRTSLELYAQAWSGARDIIEGSETGLAAINTAYQNQKQIIEPLRQMWLDESLSMEDRTAAAKRYATALDAMNQQQKRQKEDAMRTADNAAQMNPLTEVEQLTKDYENRRRTILEQHNWEQKEAEDHLNELDKQFGRQKVWTQVGEYAQTGSELVGSAMEAMTASGRENSKEMQNLAIGQALINQALAVSEVWKGSGSLPEKIAKSAIAAFQVGAQIKQIRSQSFATGGAVQGPGTPTSDSIPAWLSTGEFVMNANAVQKIGMRNLEAMNDGQMPKFSDGGMPKLSVNNSGGSTSNGNIEFVVINNSSNVDVEQSEETDADGNRRLVATITDVVNNGMNTGSFDRSMGRNFGVTRQGRGR